jgi:hypothetical protein
MRIGQSAYPSSRVVAPTLGNTGIRPEQQVPTQKVGPDWGSWLKPGTADMRQRVIAGMRRRLMRV